MPFLQGKLAEVEAEMESTDAALVRIERGAGVRERDGTTPKRRFPASHPRRNPTQADPERYEKRAEEFFLAAIAIAQTRARTDHLHAALAAAKLYQTTGRPADARAVLAPALEGFTPRPNSLKSRKHKHYLARFPLRLLADDIAKWRPPFTVELDELHLIVGSVVCRGGI